MSHKEAFEMLEGQLMSLHSSAQNMANLYCTQQSLQTLLIANPSNRSKEEPKPEKKQNDDAVFKKIEEISQELKKLKNINLLEDWPQIWGEDHPSLELNKDPP